ncbi:MULTISPECIES: restriction endonuclease subunit S [Cyanophyceae]|uniref:restriction endonuclease subunit S n=1 Tax=Cyanophyceae TaxID=3028117 RepID=UPI001684DB7E|nr:restriction endonuclease subunit S [Trichocoleus sp. FACHB-69]MBD1933342.1 restriction endonuclease subunit S [Trichocoleus sp. FACHB-69]
MRETLVKTEELKDSPVEKIPKDWEIVSLKNEINILHGYAFEGEYFSDEPPGDVLLVPGNFHRDGGLYFDDNNTKYYRGLIPDGTVLENGQLLIVMTDLSPRTLILGRVVLLELPFRVLHNQRIGKIVPKLPNTWDKRFLLLVMNSDMVRRNIISNATGTTVRHTSPDRILANVVPKPPIEEQSKIAEILNTIDETIAHTSSLIAKFKQMKAGLLHDLLTRGLDENGELRDAIAHPEQFKDSPLGQIPSDWKCEKLQHLCKTPIRDFGSFSMTNLIQFLNSGIPFLKSEMVEEENLNTENLTFISLKVHNLLKKSWVYPGNILYSKIGSALGKAVLYDGHLGICNSNAAIAKIDINETIALPMYVVHILNSIEGKGRIMKSIVSLLPRINLTDIYNFELALPPISEQHRIIEILESNEKRINAEEAYCEKLKLQKQGLMHDLLTGKVRVKDA